MLALLAHEFEPADRALRYYQQILLLEPNDISARLGMAMVLRLLKRSNDARAILTAARALARSDEKWLVQVETALIELQDWISGLAN